MMIRFRPSWSTGLLKVEVWCRRGSGVWCRRINHLLLSELPSSISLTPTLGRDFRPSK